MSRMSIPSGLIFILAGIIVSYYYLLAGIILMFFGVILITAWKVEKNLKKSRRADKNKKTRKKKQ